MSASSLSRWGKFLALVMAGLSTLIVADSASACPLQKGWLHSIFSRPESAYTSAPSYTSAPTSTPYYAQGGSVPYYPQTGPAVYYRTVPAPVPAPALPQSYQGSHSPTHSSPTPSYSRFGIRSTVREGELSLPERVSVLELRSEALEARVRRLEPVTPPPPPPPSPDAAPIPVPGFRVLMVYESGTLSRLPASQLAVLSSTEIRLYLIARCVKGVDGKTSEWRVYDQNVNLSAETPLWKAAMQRPRKSIPWILISTGTSGFEGPLPATIKETLELLKRYGG